MLQTNEKRINSSFGKKKSFIGSATGCWFFQSTRKQIYIAVLDYYFCFCSYRFAMKRFEKLTLAYKKNLQTRKYVLRLLIVIFFTEKTN